jgi:hypothetical protein
MLCGWWLKYKLFYWEGHVDRCSLLLHDIATRDSTVSQDYWIQRRHTHIDICYVVSRGGSRIGTVELQHPLLPLDIIDNISYNESFFFNSFFILVQYRILKLNVSSHPPVYEKDTKIFVWNCALRSSSGVVFDCCAHAHIGSCTRARRWDRARRALSLPQCRPWRAGGRFFFTPRVLCLLIFSRKLKQEEWISFLN